MLYAFEPETKELFLKWPFSPGVSKWVEVLYCAPFLGLLILLFLAGRRLLFIAFALKVISLAGINVDSFIFIITRDRRGRSLKSHPLFSCIH